MKSYVHSLGEEACEWLLALFVDDDLRLLAVDTVAQGAIADCPLPVWKLMNRGHLLQAKGIILVHNHPSGEAQPSDSDVRLTVRLAHIARELEMPLLDHLIVAGDEMVSCGSF